MVAGDRRTRRGASGQPARTGLFVVLGFAGLIVLGMMLLMLPVATRSGESAPVSVALFTSTSAVCVTGLTVVDTGSYWSRFGQIVIMSLVQIGGVGFGAAATLLFWLIGRNISIRDRRMLSDIVPGSNLAQAARTALYIAGVSVAIQAIGALVLFSSWRERYEVGEAFFLSLFHSVNAFCNAGFDAFGTLAQPGVSLAGERYNPLTILPISLLILIGGVGFPVLGEIFSWRPHRFRTTRYRHSSQHSIRPSLSLHARLVLLSHLGLFVLGVLAFWLIELNNRGTLGGQPVGNQFMDAVSTSINPRTAGFVTVPLLALQPTSLLLMLFLMFVGTASAGTGGGVKVNTVAVLLASVAATIVGRPRPQLFKRTLTQESIDKALTVVVLSAAAIAGATFALSFSETGIPQDRLLFEVVSAFSTVGLSLDVTPQLSEVGRIIIGLMMFAGRLGPLTLVVLLSVREQVPPVTYAEEPVLVG